MIFYYIFANSYYPPIDIEIERINYQAKIVYKIEIPKGKDKPYQTYKHQFLIRIGSTNRIATQAELMRLFQQSCVDRTSIKDFNLNKIVCKKIILKVY